MQLNESQNNQINELQKQQEVSMIKVQGIEKHLKKFDDFHSALKNLEVQLQA